MATTKSVPIGVRVPAELATWLREQAEANRRSVSNQAVWALDQFRKQQEAPANATPS
jgi:predicted transcriptional regulator